MINTYFYKRVERAKVILAFLFFLLLLLLNLDMKDKGHPYESSGDLRVN